MFNESIAGRVWYCWTQCAVFGLLRRVYRRFRNAWTHSLVRGLLVLPDRVQQCYASSLFARIVDGLLRGICALLERFFTWFGRVNAGSLNARLWQRFGRSSAILKYNVLYSAFLALMFLCPHDAWNNAYGLAGAVGFAALYLCACALRTRELFSPIRLGLPLLLFALACLLSLAFTHAMGDSFRIFSLFVTSFLLCWLTAAAVKDRGSLMTLLGFLYAAVILTACYAIVQRIMGVAVNSSFTDLSENKGVPGRVFSTLDNPNNYAEFLVMMTPPAAVWAVKVRAKLGSLPLSPFLCCGLGLPFLAMVMTYSRSGWISIAIAALILLYCGDKRWIPLLVLAIPLAIPFLPRSMVTRLASMVSGNDTSAGFRVYIWRGVSLLLRDHGLTGIGLGPESFAEVYAGYARRQATQGVPHSHMVWMELLVETGISGLISFVWFFLNLLRNGAVSAARSRAPIRRLTLFAALAALIGISVTFLVEYVWYYPRDLFAFFLLCGLALGLVRAEDPPFAEAEQPQEAVRT